MCSTPGQPLAVNRAGPPAPQQTVRSFLVCLVLACLMPGVVGALVLFFHEYTHGREQLEKDTLQTVRALVQTVDGQLLKAQAVAQALSTDDALARRDLAAFHQQARQTIALVDPRINIVLSDSNGRQLVNAKRDFGEPLPLHGNQQQIRQIAATGKLAVSGLFVDAFHHPVVSVDVPVIRDGRVAYVVTVSLPSDCFNAVLQAEKMPPDQVAVVFDDQGTVFGHSQAHGRLLGQRLFQNFVEQLGPSREGSLEYTSMEGVSLLSVYSRSPMSNWGVAIGIPRQTLEADLQRTLVAIALGFAGLLAVGLGLAWRMGGRIAGSLRALIAPAFALGSGAPSQAPVVHIKEAGDVLGALDAAGRLLQERTTALGVQEATLRRFFDSSPFLMGLVSVEGEDIRHLSDNQATARFFGWPAEGIRGRLSSDLEVPPELIRFWVERYERSRIEGRPIHFEYQRQVHNGSSWLSATVGYVGTDANGFHRYSYVVEDITHRKETELQAARLNGMYLALSQTNRAVAFRCDRESLLNDVCRIATESSGFPAASITLLDPATGKAELAAFSGSADDQLAVTELCAAPPLQWKEIAKPGPACPSRQQHGAVFCLDTPYAGELRSSAVYPLFVEGEAVAAFNVYSHDADAFDAQLLDVLEEMASVLSFGLENLEREHRRRSAEDSLRESRNMLFRVMDLAPLLIYLYDVETGYNLYANRAAATITGNGAEEIQAMNTHLVQALVHPDDLPRLTLALERWHDVAEGEAIEYECRIASRNGEWRHLSLREVVIARQADGRPLQILGVGEDVTTRVGQQQAQERKQADFARMGRLVTMGEMASALAHELNQPLAAITNFAQACLNLIRKGQAERPELEQGLEKTVAQALRAGSILRTVREFVRKRDANPQRIDINATIGEAVEFARIRTRGRGRAIEHVLHLEPDLPAAWADGILVDQVLMNLLRNAEEAMESSANPVVEISTRVSGEGFVLVSIRDFGRGLPAGFDLETLPAFYTTKADGMGVGLGICRSIIEASGGHLWAESPREVGSIFRFTLPVAAVGMHSS